MGLTQTVAKGVKYLLDPNYHFWVQARKFHKYDAMPDDEYIKRCYKARFGKNLAFESPQSYNEKLQWLKLYDRRPEYTVMVDKHLAKDYVAKIIGKEYIIPTLGVWDTPEEIDFGLLPDRFVLKCNHNSGLGMCICVDKSKLDILTVRKNLQNGLNENFFLKGREWPYKNVSRKILAEKYLENSEENGLTDYKIHCFNGIPKFVLVCQDRFVKSDLTEDFFTPEWEHMSVKRPQIPNAATLVAKPEKLDEMLLLAAKLSKDIPFLRVDFYVVEGRIYFSELTFFPASGFSPYDPPEWDDVFGSWLELPPKYSSE